MDFEDITVGVDVNSGVSFVYVGDFGNNNYDRTVSTIYRFPEPDLSSLGYAFHVRTLYIGIVRAVQWWQNLESCLSRNRPNLIKYNVGEE